MSIKLTTLCFNIINLSSTEKQILTPLCFRANDKNECWSSIERLEIDTGLKRRTIEPALKKLRDKNILMYSGQYKGSSGKIPVYCINLDNGNFCRDKDLITAIFVYDTGNFCIEITAKIAAHKDNVKNNRKDNEKFSIFTPQTPKTQSPGVLDFQEYKAGKKGYEWVGEWMLDNK